MHKMYFLIGLHTLEKYVFSDSGAFAENRGCFLFGNILQ